MHKWTLGNLTYGKSQLIAFQHVSATSKPGELHLLILHVWYDLHIGRHVRRVTRLQSSEVLQALYAPSSTLVLPAFTLGARATSIKILLCLPGSYLVPAWFLPCSSLNHQNNTVR